MKSSSYHHGDLRDALIGAALAILEEGGDPTALSLRETARRAGVSAMAPYRHFADKDALLAAVAAIGFTRLAEALGKADRAKDAVDALVGQGVAYVGFACAHPSLFRLMFGNALAERHGPFAAIGQSAYSVMSTRVGGLETPEKADDWALCCWATAHGLACLAVDGKLVERGEPAIVLADRVLRLLPVGRGSQR